MRFCGYSEYKLSLVDANSEAISCGCYQIRLDHMVQHGRSLNCRWDEIIASSGVPIVFMAPTVIT